MPNKAISKPKAARGSTKPGITTTSSQKKIEEPPAAPKEPVVKPETVSLIDEHGELVKTAPQPRRKSVLPPISRFKTSGPVQKEPEPVEPPVEEPQAPEEPAPADEVVETPENVIHLKSGFTVSDLAEKIGVKPFVLIGELMEMEIFAAKNHTIEADVAAKICEKHGFIFEREKRQTGAGVHKPKPIEIPVAPPVEEIPEEKLTSRAPVVTFMGHVDHGKTSLLDAIRKARVASGEAGGITQHIGAYSVTHEGKSITFLDTPGHEAFTQMRARGATVTDIVVIVIAADDGIMPTTLEAIAHAKAARDANPDHFAIMVAINKVDLPSANVLRVKTQLQEKGLAVEEFGGEIVCTEVSATKGTGIDQLLENILLQAEVLDLKSSRSDKPRGRVIEAQLEAGRGATGTVVVQAGTMKVGQPFICGPYFGKIKSLLDHQNKPIKEAGPSTPVRILGFSGLPYAGDEFLVMDSERDAKAVSEERMLERRNEKLVRPARATLESVMDTSGDAVKELSIVLKADVQGSLEALVGALNQIESQKVTLNIVNAAVGPVSESDVLLATASNAVVIGFGVKVDNGALKAAKKEGIQINLYSIIYELIDQIKDAMAGLLDPELRQAIIGHAEVKQVFELSKGIVAGCYVTDGRVSRVARARVLRGKQAVYDGSVATLRRFQDDVKEVRAGVECGIKLGDYTEYEPGDVIECYTLEKFAQKL